MNKTRPNLFHYAKSELSQDAFLCWLLEWADVLHRETNPAMHTLAQRFISALFRAANIDPPEDQSQIRILKQLEHIDIVAEIGQNHILAIEDKVHSSEHSNQLETYSATLTRLYQNRHRALIYLKTGDQSSYHAVSQSGWTIFPRRLLLETLQCDQEQPQNIILEDFIEHIKTIESDTSRYLTIPVKDWEKKDTAYRGLFAELQRQMGCGEWKLVNYPGDFFAFWWATVPIEHGRIYLQIEEKKLKVKVAVDEEEWRERVRDLWVERFTVVPEPHSPQESMSARLTRAMTSSEPHYFFKRPAKLKKGKSMTVAVAKFDHISYKNEFIDIASTVNHLKTMSNIFMSAVSKPSKI